MISDRLKAWNAVLYKLNTSESDSAIVSKEDEAQKIVSDVLNLSFMTSLWIDIFHNYSSSQTFLSNEITRLLLSYRLFSNYFKFTKEFTVGMSAYDELLVHSLVLCIKDCSQLYTTSLSFAFDSLSKSHLPLLLTFIFNDQYTNAVLSVISSSLALKCLHMSQKPNKRTASIESPQLSSVLQQLLSKTNQEIPMDILIEELCMFVPSNEVYATALVTFIGTDWYVFALDRVAALWGDAKFISRGDQPMQVYLTCLLRLLLSRLTDKAALLDKGPRGIPPLILLSTGVSAYLSCNDRNSRARAMEIAKLFTAIMGQEVQFSSVGDLGGVSTTTPPITDKPQVSVATIPTPPDDDHDDDDSDNDDGYSSGGFSELEVYEDVGFSSGEGGGIGATAAGHVQSKYKTVYLRTCLECKRHSHSQYYIILFILLRVCLTYMCVCICVLVLQYSETKEHAHDKHRDALVRSHL